MNNLYIGRDVDTGYGGDGKIYMELGIIVKSKRSKPEDFTTTDVLVNQPTFVIVIFNCFIAFQNNQILGNPTLRCQSFLKAAVCSSVLRLIDWSVVPFCVSFVNYEQERIQENLENEPVFHTVRRDDWDSGCESGHGARVGRNTETKCLKPSVPIFLHCPDPPRLTVSAFQEGKD